MPFPPKRPRSERRLDWPRPVPGLSAPAFRQPHPHRPDTQLRAKSKWTYCNDYEPKT